MTSFRACAVILVVSSFFLRTTVVGAPNAAFGKIELLRDTWGIPHVFSSTDEGAMYGLGYASAEERGFQMTYSLRIMQGRLAEILGPRPRAGRRETAVDNDRKMRTFGWEQAALNVAGNLDNRTKDLLAAYCQGVNDGFAEQKRAGRLHPLFAQLAVTPEPWRPADCLLSWWHLAQYFSTDGTRELLAWRNEVNPPRDMPQAPQISTTWVDDSTAVVQKEDVSAEWLKQVEQYEFKPANASGNSGETGPKFSHAWVVGKQKSSTGSAVLVSDPQTPVRNPSLLFEFHVAGKSFNARGVGVPGSPVLLIGFNEHIAWGMTALGADQADLFRLETATEQPNRYRWNGSWREMQIRTEHIKVKGSEDVAVEVRETHLGPIVDEFAFRMAGDPHVALKRVPLCDRNVETIQASFGMKRARTSAEFLQALGGWRFPTANCVFGDANGDIGYSVVGAIPLRSSSTFDAQGRFATIGSKDEHDWRGFVPPGLLPQVLNPKQGYLFSANHRPVGAFYQIPLGLSTGSMGDTLRSWRLRELLSAKETFTPEDVLQVHYDTVNPARREIVNLGLEMREQNPDALSEEAKKALAVLEKWFVAGASSDLSNPGAELATRISTFFRFVTTPLALKYGGGESGLARFLKDASQRIGKEPAPSFSEEEIRFIDDVLAQAWSDSAGGQTAGARGARGGTSSAGSLLGWFDSLHGFGTLDSVGDMPGTGLTCLDGQTIGAQPGQSYTQFVPLHDADAALTICPVGHSDRLDSRFRSSTARLWSEKKLHPAPLSRAGVAKISGTPVVLSKADFKD